MQQVPYKFHSLGAVNALRGIGTPEEAAAVLVDRPGLTLPNRKPEHIASQGLAT